MMQDAHSDDSVIRDVTQILEEVGRGDPRASEALLPLVYEELHLSTRSYK